MSTSSAKGLQGLSSRKRNLKPKKSIIFIACEGEKTEPIYFGSLKPKIGRDIAINIEIVTGETPSGLVGYAKRLLSNSGFDQKRDQIWCVFDVDDTDNAEIRKAHGRAGHRIRIAMSNPCFELWYLLHFGGSSASLSQSEALDRLQKQIPGYKKNKSVTSTIMESTKKASRNAKLLRRFHEYNGTDLLSREANPCTFVDVLIDRLLHLAEGAKGSGS